jgi:two-component system phosphate regulon response regulator PhoB
MPRVGASVLVVDDDPEVRMVVSWRLEADGFAVRQAADGEEAVRELAWAGADLIVLDLSLPGIGGLDVLSRVRAERETPIIVLSGRAGERDRIVGLDLGADDYLAKPFSPDELAARVRSLLRRANGGAHERLELGPLAIDVGRREVRLHGEPVELTAKELDLLAFLAARPGQVFTRGQLLQHVWNSSSDWQEEATVTQHVHRLRRKLEVDPSHPRVLRTVFNAGYRFDPPVAA